MKIPFNIKLGDKICDFNMKLLKKKNLELESLMKETDIKTKREFIDAAVFLLIWSIDETKAGRIVGSYTERGNEFKEVVIPPLINIQKSL